MYLPFIHYYLSSLCAAFFLRLMLWPLPPGTKSVEGKNPSHNLVRVCSELMTTSEWTHQIRNSSYFPPTAKRKKRSWRWRWRWRRSYRRSPAPSVVHILSQCEWWTASFSISFRLSTSSHKWFKTKSDLEPRLWPGTLDSNPSANFFPNWLGWGYFLWFSTPTRAIGAVPTK